ncbi:MAG TPA: hypothetical protein VHQ43_05405 [Solirubrobacterales bacterium]|jgi:hypothetical protein|nr:hypothetical protein [Solirubrobacterales bacterium]
MRFRATAAILLASAAALCLASAAAAALIGVYRNTMENDAQRGQILKLSGERCSRGGSATAFKIVVGKATRECAYRTPVIGRDLEIAAVGRLLSSTPKPVQRKAFLSLELRAGSAAAGYQLVAFPLQRKVQLRKVSADGNVEYLHIEKNVMTLQGADKANQLRLRAFNLTSGPEKGSSRVLAYVGAKLVADVTDPAAGELEGRASAFAAGAGGNAKGTAASFDDVVVRVPSPF